MKIQIRPIQSEEYETIAAIQNQVFAEYPTTAEDIRLFDEKIDPKCHFQRFVVEHDGEIIAFATHDQRIWSYHPQIFDFDLVVPLEFRSQNLLEQIYDYLVRAIEPYNPIKIRTFFREDYKVFQEFFEGLGYVVTMRSWESRLNVSTFNFSPFANLLQEIKRSEIELVPLSQIPESEERNRALHKLENELGQDVPSDDPFTPITYEFFVERTLKNPNLYPDGYYLAMDGNKLIGMSALWTSKASEDLYTGLTGVKGDYRRRGIALALKLKTIEVAKRVGCPQIKTWNASNNKGMLAINNRLGYVRQPQWISYAKKL